jgi:hypothetical protein
LVHFSGFGIVNQEKSGNPCLKREKFVAARHHGIRRRRTYPRSGRKKQQEKVD